MICLFYVYVLGNEIECTNGFQLVENQCQCQSKLSSDGLQCVSKCADIGEALKEQGNQLQISQCHKCDRKASREDDDYCLSIQKLSAMKVCGKYARPDPNTCLTSCICNDTTQVLQADGMNCKCKVGTYFNLYFRSCISCLIGTPDISQTFCICPINTYYFSHVSQSCILCSVGSITSSTSNVCSCKTDKQYIRSDICAGCGDGSISTADELTCSCSLKINKRFDEFQNKCLDCGTAFSASITYNDRSVCVCGTFGYVNINNVSCQQCVSGSVDKNPGATNVAGCRCINSSYFWSAQNNTCTLCPFGIADNDNNCVCPPNSQPDNVNNSCICYGNYQFDGHNCIACPDNFNVINGICRFNSSANPYCIQQVCPANSVPNADNTNCVCNGNYFYTRSNNTCTLCPWGSTVSNNICAINQYTGIYPLVLCGRHAKPDPSTGNISCMCNDSSLILLSDGLNCQCPSTKYFNTIDRTCLACPSGLNPDGTQLFCVCSSTSYFDLISQSCLSCPTESSSSAIQNECSCKKDKQYIRAEKCAGCGGGATASTADGLSCSCQGKDITRFDEVYNMCMTCGAAFSASITYKDRSTCVCPIGKVNINNDTCQTCVSGSIDKNPGATNVAGCRCINSSYFWSAQNNTCTLCPFGIADNDNNCVCPPNSQPDNVNNSCICYGNYQFDGHNCIACPDNFNVINGICRFNSSANPYCIQQVCPANSVPNADNTNCVCNGNYFYTRSNNTCTLCPWGSTVSNNICAINQYTGIYPLVLCGRHAKPDPSTGNISCMCNDSSLILLSDGLNCQCPSTKYFNTIDRTCLACPSGLNPDGTQLFCVCSSTSYFDVVTKSCRVCPTDSITSPVQNICNCKKDKAYIRPTNNKCEGCGGGSIASTADGLSCSCDNNKQSVTRFDESQNKCVPCGSAFLGATSYNDRSVCVCGTFGYVNINNVSCQQCVSGSVDKNPGATNVAGCRCINSSYFWSAQNNTCTLCPFGIADNDNNCVCPKYSQINNQNNGCICYGNYVFDGHYCVGSNNCPIGSTASSDNSTCICSGNNYYTGSVCSACPIYSIVVSNICACPQFSMIISNVCVCDQNSYMISNSGGVLSCFKCPSGATPDNTNKTCTCPANKFYSSGNNTCTSCLSNSHLDNNECVCDSDSYLSSNTSGVLSCFKCPSGATPDNTNKTCTCPANKFYSSGNNTCTSCLSNSTLVNNECVCDSDSYLSSNTSGVLSCFKCPSGATPDNTNKTCTCPANKFYSSGNNTCTSCLSNSTLVNNECVCDSDSYLSSNTSGVLTCFKCPSGATPDNTNKTCTCPANKFYSSGNNTCTSCLSNSTLVNNECVCDSDSYLSSNTSGVLSCFKCPSGATPDNTNKTCTCPANKFYSSDNNTCTSCLSNSTLVNNECVCDSDSYLSSNTSGVLTCFKCPSGATPDNTNKTCTCPANQFYSSGNNTCTSCLSNSTIWLIMNVYATLIPT
ncbi:Conserved_hypothetical protein [Hexamita inflata]|uniref:Peptidase M12B domain-containing protein n=1 Tax=Hexamita inflata TaxID=28002 RepID=A0AA86PB28_9EUKA|nr:Conserved hypothetical protein [Hexamita inflata]